MPHRKVELQEVHTGNSEKREKKIQIQVLQFSLKTKERTKERVCLCSAEGRDKNSITFNVASIALPAFGGNHG